MRNTEFRTERVGSWEIAWKGDRIEAARFRRNAHEKMASVPTALDPEDQEGLDIESFLSRPESKCIRHLEIWMIDFHRSPQRAVQALSSMDRPELQSFYFAIDGPNAYRWASQLSKRPTSSAGRPISANECPATLVNSTATSDLWKALPALKRLALNGDYLFPDLAHDGLTWLWVRASIEAIPGLIFGENGLINGKGRPPTLPTLRFLQAFTGPDDWGGIPDCTLLDVPIQRFPCLEDLDLRGVELDIAQGEAGDFDWLTSFLAISRLPIVAQLKTLGVGNIDSGENRYDTPEILADASPRLRHLSRLLASRTSGDEAVCRSYFPNLSIQPPSHEPPTPQTLGATSSFS